MCALSLPRATTTNQLAENFHVLEINIKYLLLYYPVDFGSLFHVSIDSQLYHDHECSPFYSTTLIELMKRIYFRINKSILLR